MSTYTKTISEEPIAESECPICLHRSDECARSGEAVLERGDEGLRLSRAIYILVRNGRVIINWEDRVPKGAEGEEEAELIARGVLIELRATGRVGVMSHTEGLEHFDVEVPLLSDELTPETEEPTTAPTPKS